MTIRSVVRLPSGRRFRWRCSRSAKLGGAAGVPSSPRFEVWSAGRHRLFALTQHREHRRRYLVPARAFCEPDEGKPARWHWFALKGSKERPLFAFAGIYRQWNEDGANVDLEVFSFMTTLPNTLILASVSVLAVFKLFLGR
jgi:hypothetical protein